MADERGWHRTMAPEEKVLRKLYVAVLGFVATFAAQKLLTMGWKAVTGNEPPSPTDPQTPFRQALSWVLASAIGIGVTQLAAQRLANKRWSDETGTEPEGKGSNKVRVIV
jgi:hypothetical protein